MVCHDVSGGTGTFKESRDFFVKSVEKMDANSKFRIVKNCKIQGSECFKRNIWNGTVFFFLMLVAGLAINFLHELLHYAFFVSAGYPASFTFSAYTGFTIASGVPDFTDPSVPWWWWYFSIFSPLLVVDLLAVVVAMSTVNHDSKNPPFIDERLSRGSTVFLKTFFKAVAYISAFSVLMNTILAPVYNIFYSIIGFPGKTSDLATAWLVAVSIPDVASAIAMQITIVISTVAIVSCTILYVFLFNRRENGSD